MEDQDKIGLTEACRVAGEHAALTDLNATFPQRALEYLRDARLLGWAVPKRLGGKGVGPADVAEACFQLGRHCGSTALIFAMHQIQLGVVWRCARPNSWHQDFVRDCAEYELLIASSTSGRVAAATLDAPRQVSSDAVEVNRMAAVISYLEQADAVLLLASASARSGEGPGDRHDATLMVAKVAQLTYEKTGIWSGMGLRGTCTHTYAMRGVVPREQILEGAFSSLDTRVVLPLAHCHLSAAWLGMAATAIAATRLVVVEKGRHPAALLEIIGRYEVLRGAIRNVLADAEKVLSSPLDENVPDNLVRRLLLFKVTCSEMAAGLAADCLKVAGLAGYQAEPPYSVSRYVRDLLAAPIMISNFNILAAARESDLAPLEGQLFS